MLVIKQVLSRNNRFILNHLHKSLNTICSASRPALSWNLGIARLVRNHQMKDAQNLFDQMPIKDVVSWNTMLSGFNTARNPERICQCFLDMGRSGFLPNEYTLSILLSGIMDTVFASMVLQIHVRVICLSLNSLYVGSALIKAYANYSGDPFPLRRIFDEISEKNVTSWNSLIYGYMNLGCLKEARKVFDEMPHRNVVSWTTLIKGYILGKDIYKARHVFDHMNDRNVVSWTVMITGYVENAMFVEALQLFQLMVTSSTQANHFTFSVVLDACGGCSSLIFGRQVHANIIKLRALDEVVLSTSLVDMYAKCGDISASFNMFKYMPKKNVISWNSIIGGFGRHGCGERALEEFDRMRKAGIEPDKITFVNVLSACGHGGLVEEGERHFKAMESEHNIQPELEHYTCMVDLYGRAGLLEKAEELIKGMPMEADEIVWSALLGACGWDSSSETAEFAIQGISKVKKDHQSLYFMLLKINRDKEEWNSFTALRNLMKRKHIKKQTSASWIEPAH